MHHGLTGYTVHYYVCSTVRHPECIQRHDANHPTDEAVGVLPNGPAQHRSPHSQLAARQKPSPPAAKKPSPPAAKKPSSPATEKPADVKK